MNSLALNLSMPSSLQQFGVRRAAMAMSLLFSLIAILANPVLNNDAFGYLRAAQLFDEAGVRAVLDSYGWYGYSILIALLDRALPLDALGSAYLLNTALYALVVFAFITLCSEYRPGLHTQVLAAAVILLFPLLNEMRAFLIRDTGFWAFCLLALLQLVRYHRDRRLRFALAFCLSLLAATFFRLEGLVLLALAPLSLLCNPRLGWGERLRAWASVQGLLLGGLLLTFLVALAFGVHLIDLAQYAYRYYLPGLLNLGQLMVDTAVQLNWVIFAPQNFPGHSSHGLVILAGAYAYTVLVNLANALGGPLSALLLYSAWKRPCGLAPHAALPAAFFLAASLVSLLIFMTIMQFLTQRYAALACLVLLSLLPPCLDSFLNRSWATHGGNRFRIALGGIFFYLAVDSLISFGYSKDHIRDAAEWTRDHAPSGELYTNHFAIAHGSGRIPDYDRISLEAESYLGLLERGDHFAVEMNHDETDLLQALESDARLRLLARFANERGDQVRIYEVLE